MKTNLGDDVLGFFEKKCLESPEMSRNLIRIFFNFFDPPSRHLSQNLFACEIVHILKITAFLKEFLRNMCRALHLPLTWPEAWLQSWLFDENTACVVFPSHGIETSSVYHTKCDGFLAALSNLNTLCFKTGS